MREYSVHCLIIFKTEIEFIKYVCIETLFSLTPCFYLYSKDIFYIYSNLFLNNSFNYNKNIYIFICENYA